MRLHIKWVNGWAQLHGTGPNGERIRKALKTRDPEQAKEAKADYEAKLWKRGLYGEEATLTFEECALAYAEDGGDTRFILKIAEYFKGTLLKDIRPRDIRSAAKELYPTASPATLNRQAITPARAVINYGHQQGWCAPIRVRHFTSEKPKRKAVDRAYIDNLTAECNDHLAALVLFLHQTGRRIGEAIQVEPEHINLKKMTIHLPKTKNGDGFTAHITTELAGRLSDLEPRNSRVFGYMSRSAVRKALKAASKAAQVEYLGTHQIGRHSFATHLSNEGWSTKAIAEAGGWKSVRLVAEIYEHPENAALAASNVFGKKMTSAKKRRKQATGNKRKQR